MHIFDEAGIEDIIDVKTTVHPKFKFSNNKVKFINGLSSFINGILNPGNVNSVGQLPIFLSPKATDVNNGRLYAGHITDINHITNLIKLEKDASISTTLNIKGSESFLGSFVNNGEGVDTDGGVYTIISGIPLIADINDIYTWPDMYSNSRWVRLIDVTLVTPSADLHYNLKHTETTAYKGGGKFLKTHDRQNKNDKSEAMLRERNRRVIAMAVIRLKKLTELLNSNEVFTSMIDIYKEYIQSAEPKAYSARNFKQRCEWLLLVLEMIKNKRLGHDTYSFFYNDISKLSRTYTDKEIDDLELSITNYWKKLTQDITELVYNYSVEQLKEAGKDINAIGKLHTFTEIVSDNINVHNIFFTSMCIYDMLADSKARGAEFVDSLMSLFDIFKHQGIKPNIFLPKQADIGIDKKLFTSGSTNLEQYTELMKAYIDSKLWGNDFGTDELPTFASKEKSKPQLYRALSVVLGSVINEHYKKNDGSVDDSIKYSYEYFVKLDKVMTSATSLVDITNEYISKNVKAINNA